MHQADVSLLDEIRQLDTVISVFMGYLHDETQVGDDELFRRLHIVEFLQAHRQGELLLRGKEREFIYFGDIAVKGTGKGGNFQMMILIF